MFLRDSLTKWNLADSCSPDAMIDDWLTAVNCYVLTETQSFVVGTHLFMTPSSM